MYGAGRGWPRAGLGQRIGHVDVADREESGLAIDGAFEPIIIDLLRQSDGVPLLEDVMGG